MSREIAKTKQNKKTTLKPSEEREVILKQRDCTEMGRVSMSSPRRQKVKGKSHRLGWEMLKYKRQAGMRVLFQSTWYFSPLWALSPLRNQKGDQMGRLVSQTPVNNCQQEVLSPPRPSLCPGRHWLGLGPIFPREATVRARDRWV